MYIRSLNGSTALVRLQWLTSVVLLAATAVAPAPLRGQTQTTGRAYYVAPDGRSTNDGSATRPLDLATALSTASPAHPGDTIWLRSGLYRGTFTSDLNGQATAPIVVRQYPGERATIDCSPSQNAALLVRGSYTWFWGFEIMCSDPTRISSQTGSWPNDVKRGGGVEARGRGLKFINMVVHDTRQGFGLWTEAVDVEAHGNLSYYNGWRAPDRAHGHGFYTQNQTGVQRLTDNIVFQNFSHGLHSYGSDAAYLNNIQHEGNISFQNGVLAGEPTRELLLGGGSVAQNPVVKDNLTYGSQVNIGYSGGCTNGVVTGNYFTGSGVFIVNCAATVTGNTMYSIYGLGSLPTAFTQNTFLAAQPTGVVVRVRRNKYEQGRANVAVYNWSNQSHVTVDLVNAGLTIGQPFEIRDAQDFFGPSVVSATYNGMPVTLPMSGLTVDAPIGTVPVTPRHTAPRFGVFVVVPGQSTIVPEPAPAPVPEPEPTVPTMSLALSPSAIQAGGAASLSWSTTGLQSLTIDALGPVASNGSTTVRPTQTTRYTLKGQTTTGEWVVRTATLTVASIAPTSTTSTTATFVGFDTTTQGSWRGKYGVDGYVIAAATPRPPAYATVTPRANLWKWTAPTTDVRALYDPATNLRYAASWYDDPVVPVDLTINSTTTRRIAAYFVDWDARSRTDVVQVMDLATGAILDQRTLANFVGGQYLVWDVRGRIRLRVLKESGPNAVVSAIFFGPG